jgi:hypothetical protein
MRRTVSALADEGMRRVSVMIWVFGYFMETAEGVVEGL